jgi:hypothetical protein
MPRRVFDLEKAASSWKLCNVTPPEYRIFYPWGISMALANGVFECDPRVVHGKIFRVLDWLTPEVLGKIFDEYERVGLLFRWKEPDGTLWGYWTGIHSPGLLPAQSRIDDRHYPQGPQVPQGAFVTFCLEKNIRRNGHGPGATLTEVEVENESRKQLSDKIKKLSKDKQF